MAAPVVASVLEAAAPLLAELHAESFPPADRWSVQAIGLLVALPGHFALLATAAGEPLGFALGRVAAEEAEVLTLAVRPAARRVGTGRALMRALMAESARRGARTLFLEVAEGNLAARTLYDRLGAAVAGRRRRYYPNGSDALVLSLPLSPSGAATGG
ncbi:GNAT family N-acetyltransferase [Roseomonas soli]|uniref:GNAT family N-acetyltransferase n=2 Tax=Neoroseomonas soli TaxID=1081025 RepID=A0A9X9X3D7_9PROT|nr:GNAT family N-acetyltransferase [Neoroseomonas soli]MBR0673916.1 GNAT family N-acetyltransferase [Neoroseomonas soli]